MEIAKIQVSGVIAQAVSLQNIPAGIIGAEVAFAYIDPMWDALTKTVVLKGCCTKDIVDAGDTVIVPAEVVATPGVRVYVGVYGVDAAGTIAIPTLWATLGITRAAADPSGDESTDPALPVWAQIQAVIGDLEELNTESKETLVAAINEALTKGGGTVDEATVYKIVEDYLAENSPGQGADGGYYTPAVTQPDVETMEISFAPSNEEMPAVEPVQIKLPVPDSSQNANGLSETASALLITILRNGVYSTDQSANITALETALASSGDSGSDDSGSGETEVTLTSISATYSGGDVPIGTAVSDLTGIVVVASYSDGSAEAVTDYTLSGEIAEGENTITVTFESMTATFAVTGVAENSGDEVENSGWTEGEAYAIEWTDGYKLDNSTGAETADTARSVSGFIPCLGVSAFVGGSGINGGYLFAYDAEYNYLGRIIFNASYPCAVNREVAYVKMHCLTANKETATLIPYVYDELTENTAWEADKYYNIPYIEDTIISETTGAESSTTGWWASYYAFCYGATTLNILPYTTSTTWRTKVVFYDSEKNYISGKLAGSSPFTVPENAMYFRVSSYDGFEYTIQKSNRPWVQLA